MGNFLIFIYFFYKSYVLNKFSKLSAQNFNKVRKNYSPSMVEFKFDVCDLMDSNGIHTRFIPEMKEMFKAVIHRCPYTVSGLVRKYMIFFINLKYIFLKGRVELKDYNINGRVLTQFLSSGSYRFDYRFFDGEEISYFKVKYYFYVSRR
jgi:hypothetical protein